LFDVGIPHVFNKKHIAYLYLFLIWTNFFEGTEGAEAPTEIKLKNKSSPVTRQRAQETKKETKKLG
jgi:hypothetical protein